MLPVPVPRPVWSDGAEQCYICGSPELPPGLKQRSSSSWEIDINSFQLVNFHANNCPSLHDLDLAAALPLQHSSSRYCGSSLERTGEPGLGSSIVINPFRLRLQCLYVYEAPHLTIESFNIILEACPNLRQVIGFFIDPK